MTNYTDGQIVSDADIQNAIESLEAAIQLGFSPHQGVIVLLRSLLAERQAAKAGVVTDEVMQTVLHAVFANPHRLDESHPSYIKVRAALASVWPTAGGDGKLDKAARVGGATFGVGVPWSTVIGAAQREYERKPLTPEQIAKLREMFPPKIAAAEGEK